MKQIKTNLLLILLSLISLSCSDRKTRCYSCDRQESLKVADFVSNNIKDSNNMSDEEMEDVISELRKTGIRLYCRQVMVPCNFESRIRWEEIEKDSLHTLHPYIY